MSHLHTHIYQDYQGILNKSISESNPAHSRDALHPEVALSSFKVLSLGDCAPQCFVGEKSLSVDLSADSPPVEEIQLACSKKAVVPAKPYLTPHLNTTGKRKGSQLHFLSHSHFT